MVRSRCLDGVVIWMPDGIEVQANVFDLFMAIFCTALFMVLLQLC